MCVEFFGSMNILARLSPLQWWCYTTDRLTADGPLGPFSSSNITASLPLGKVATKDLAGLVEE